MKKFSFLLLILLFPALCWGATETFYLTATGAGTKTGTSLANAMSPTEFNTAGNWDTDDEDDNKIGPNDDVLIYDDHGNINAKLTIQGSGLSGKPITIKAGTGESPVIDAQATRASCIYIDGDDYITLQGDITLQGASGGAWPESCLYVTEGSTNLVFDGLTVKTGEWGICMYSDNSESPIQYVQITNCDIDSNADLGIFIYRHNHDIEIGPDNKIHDTAKINCGFGIEIGQGNTGSADVAGENIEIHHNEIYSNYSQGIRPGRRSRYLWIHHNDIHDNGATGIQTEVDCKYYVIEYNDSYHNADIYEYETGAWASNSDYGVVRFNNLFDNKIGFIAQGSEQVIFHHNNVYNNNRGAISLTNAKGICFQDSTNNTYVIHNTFYNNSHADASNGAQVCAMTSASNMVFKNNIVSITGNSYELNKASGTSGWVSDYNCWHDDDAFSARWDGSTKNWADYKTASGQDGNSENQNPIFMNPPSDMALQSGSPCIDTGTFLTTVASANGSGTSFVVGDARYFCDGFDTGADGDFIIVGSNSLVEVTDVNYSTDTITVASSISWTQGDNVSFDYEGTAPDMGANEYTSSITATLTGTLADGATEAQIVAGGETLIVTLSYDTWVATFGDDNQITTDFILGLDSGGSEAAGWDAEVKGDGTNHLTHAHVVRTNNTTATITLPAFGSYSITQNETVTLTIPASSLTESDSPVVATPTFEITATSDPAASLTGTLADNATEAQIVTGGETLIITLTNDTWVAAGATFDGIRQDIIDGMDSAQAEGTGWNAEVRDKEVVTAVVRTNDTTVTITLTAAAAYDISANESITMTVPASALVTSGDPVVATPAFAIIFFDTSTEEIVGMTLQ